MKKIIFALMACVAMFGFTACSSTVTLERLYTVTPDENGQGTGTVSQCDNKCKAAINAAMDEIEAAEGYGQGFRELKGVRVKLMYRNTDKKPKVDEEIWYRDFK